MNCLLSTLSRDAARALFILAEAADTKGEFSASPETILVVSGDFSEERALAVIRELEETAFLLFYIDGAGDSAFFRLDTGKFAREYATLEAMKAGAISVSPRAYSA